MSYNVELPIVGGDNELEMFLQLINLGRISRSMGSEEPGSPFKLKVRLRNKSGSLETNEIYCRLRGIVASDETGERWKINGRLGLNFRTRALHHPQLEGDHKAFHATYNTRTRKGTLYLTIH